MPQYLHLSPDEILGDCLDGGRQQWEQVLDTGVTVAEAVQGVLDGTLETTDIPMVEVERHSGQWYCVDNRPLAVFRRLHQVGQCDTIKVKVVCRRGQGHKELADDFNELKITVGERGKRIVAVHHEEDLFENGVIEEEPVGLRGKKTQDDAGVSESISNSERASSSLSRSAMSKSLPSRRSALSAIAQTGSAKASPITRRSVVNHTKPTESTMARSAVRRAPSVESPSQNGRNLSKSTTSESHNGRISHRAVTPLSRSSVKHESMVSNFVRSGSGRGSSINSNFVRSGSGRGGTGVISSFVRSGSGRGSGLGSNATDTGPSRGTSSVSTTNNINRPTRSSSSRTNGTSSRLSSSSFTNGDKRPQTPKNVPQSKTISASHSSTSTSSSNGPDEPRTLSEHEMQGSESDDELLFVFDGHGNNQRLPIDMLAETDKHIRTLNHRCWKCRKYFQSKQELWIHKKQLDH